VVSIDDLEFLVGTREMALITRYGCSIDRWDFPFYSGFAISLAGQASAC